MKIGNIQQSEYGALLRSHIFGTEWYMALKMKTPKEKFIKN